MNDLRSSEGLVEELLPIEDKDRWEHLPTCSPNIRKLRAAPIVGLLLWFPDTSLQDEVLVLVGQQLWPALQFSAATIVVY